MSFRKEYKFRLTPYEIELLKSQLMSKGMKKHHPERKINSLYFDTKDFTLFSQSEEGLVPRSKYRVRWYNDNTKKFFEEKTSSIEGRFKTSFCISENTFKIIYNQGLFKKKYGILFPSILVTYNRNYYLFKGLRVTFDVKINYSNFSSNFNIQRGDTETVLEVKTANELPEGYIFKHFPYSISRFSKYCRGFHIHNKSL